MILPGSYANGFAPRDGRPLYPELWRGCVGAWAPCLGPTGLVLRDWSGFGNHGTLTNMDAAGDWVPSDKWYALDFDGTNDYVDVSNPTSLHNQNFSISLWVNPRAQSSAIKAIIDFSHNYQTTPSPTRHGSWVIQSEDATTNRFYYLAYNSGNNTTFTVQPTSGAGIGVQITTGEWQHLAYTKTGTTVRGYRNGVLVWSPAAASSSTVFYLAGLGLQIASVVGHTVRNFNGLIDSLCLYNRGLSPQEIRILATRPGIAYEMAPRRRSSSTVIAAFNRRRRLLIGATS